MLVAVNLRRELAAEPGCPGLANVDTPSLFVEGTRDVMTQHLGAENALSSPDHLVGHIVRRVEENADARPSRAADAQDVQFRRELRSSPDEPDSFGDGSLLTGAILGRLRPGD